MDRHVRYEPLPTEETISDSPSSQATVVAPSVTLNEVETTQDQVSTEPAVSEEARNEIPLETPDAPPAYYLATSLPSYEESERHKLEEVVGETQIPNSDDTCSSRCGTDYDLGTDIIFWCTFILAFLFNWIGFLASMCITQSIAGRYGALAGFGLSLVKWTFIVKHSTDLISDTDWFWWIIMIFGFLIFFRGCTQYIRIKHHWTQLSAQAKERLILYY